MPEVVGFKLTGNSPKERPPPTLALTVTQMLRKKGVVGKFVEFYGPGLTNISLADRATVANMAPEYGATMGFFPVDEETLNYLRTDRPRRRARSQLVEAYYKAQDMFRTDDTPGSGLHRHHRTGSVDVVPSLAGPRRPQDRIELTDMKETWNETLRKPIDEGGFGLSEEKRQESQVKRRTANPRAENGCRRYRRDHQLHQHFQPVGDAGRRPCWPRKRWRKA